MGDLSFFEFIFNVCRSVSDVLHICCYLLLVIVAMVIALYKFDPKLYKYYVYFPLIVLMFKREDIKIVRITEHGRRAQRKYKLVFWTSSSNRLPYYLKIVRDFFNKFQ